MLRLRRITESEDKIEMMLFNLCDTLKRKGWDVNLTPKGIRVSFTYDSESSFDPHKTPEAKKWLKENEGKDFVFKGWGKQGTYFWTIQRDSSNRLNLVTKDVSVEGDTNLLALQKKLKAPKDLGIDGTLTGKSAQPFKAPDPVIFTNTMGSSFMNLIKTLHKHIMNDVALALSEVVILNKGKDKKERVLYEVEYDDNYNRVFEGVVNEAVLPSEDERFYVVMGDTESYNNIASEEGFATLDEAKGCADALFANNPDLCCAIVSMVGDMDMEAFLDSINNGDRGILYSPCTQSDCPNEEDNVSVSVVEDPIVQDMSMGSTQGVDNTQDMSMDNTQDMDQDVVNDVALDRLTSTLMLSLIPADCPYSECPYEECDHIGWVYLTPSYSISPVADIVIPIRILNNTVSLPIADIPSPDSVFGDTPKKDTAIQDYSKAIQDYLIRDVPFSDIAPLELDNADMIKGTLVEHINNMAEQYLSMKSALIDDMDIKGESLLKESRYFIVPDNTDLSSDKEVEKVNKIGYTDLAIARNNLRDLQDSGKYDFDLKILDTHYSNNRDKWEIL